MEAKEFQWDDSLVIEFVEQFASIGKTSVEQFKASKQRKALWVTDGDNVEVFDGDNVFFVNKFTYKSNSLTVSEDWMKYREKENGVHNSIYFSTREAAESYIAKKAKLYSIEDVREAYKAVSGNLFVTMDTIISELQKKK